jgi:hypothetical protein
VILDINGYFAAETGAFGNIDLEITGLPTGTAASVSVSSSTGFSAVLTASQNRRVPAGTYTVAANPVLVGNVTYSGSPAQQAVDVTAGSSSPVSVSYAASQGTAAITSVNPSSGAAGQVLTVVVTATNTNFAAGQTTASFGPGIAVADAGRDDRGKSNHRNSSTHD